MIVASRLVPTLVVGAIALLASACSQGDEPRDLRFKQFDSIYEPSGVAQLDDGRFIVVQDESAHPFDLFELQADGQVREQPLYRSSLFSWISSNRALGGFDDLEALALDNTRNIYAITSHSRKQSGKRGKAREMLIRFRLSGDQSTDIQTFDELRKHIKKAHPDLKEATKLREVKEDGGFNIEGMSFDADKQKLLIGLRAPQSEAGDALIITLENPKAIFDQNEEPVISRELIHLDLNGGGIRGIAWDAKLQGYLVLSRKGDKKFKLWLWDGNPQNKPQRIKIPGLKNLRQAEGITPVSHNGIQQGILIVSDDGNGLSGKGGHYLYLRYDQLRIK